MSEKKVHLRYRGEKVSECGIYITNPDIHHSTFLEKNVTCHACRRIVDKGRENQTVGARLRAMGLKT